MKIAIFHNFMDNITPEKLAETIEKVNAMSLQEIEEFGRKSLTRAREFDTYSCMEKIETIIKT